MIKEVDVTVLTDENIIKRIAFGDKLLKDCKGTLPAHLEEEYQNLKAEQNRRLNNLDGAGI